MVKEQHRLRVGITCGDINGIGYEVIIKAISDPRMLQMIIPVIYGSAPTLSYHRKAIRANDFQFQIVDSAKELNKKKVNIINAWTEEVKIELGKANQVSGKAALNSIEMAIGDLAAGLLDVVVTAPINKKAIQEAGFKFPGHTEYLQNYAQAPDALMIMCSENLKVAVVTGHIPLSEVAQNLTTEDIVGKIKLFHDSLERDFLIHAPKIAVLGLNPHAGENGTMGEEEQKIIHPAIKQARESGIFVHGAFPADGFFGSAQVGKYDGVLAMYHDQGLTPFKALSFGGGVNFTAGLPVVRTSPDHGTAMEIAGLNKASGDSMRRAIYEACTIFNNRLKHKEMTSNVLEIKKGKKIS
ncbi:MAG: 4-hydroxythreonine-4-phosphate dehydrogenase [Sphingobacteriales bacterium]|jgi:4-hydroxythreonine-4-phosphate dehydrogenase